MSAHQPYWQRVFHSGHLLARVGQFLHSMQLPRPTQKMGRTRHPRFTFLGSALIVLLLSCACGYHTSGTAVRLPSDLHTIYVPAIANNSQTYRVGQTLTEAVVRELRNRTNYRVVTVNNDGEADARLSGTVTGVYTAPLTYDSITGRISSSVVSISISATLTSKSGKVLWSNPHFIYREQYQESIDARTFFEEAGPAVQRIANSFAKTLVADMLEAF